MDKTAAGPSSHPPAATPNYSEKPPGKGRN